MELICPAGTPASLRAAVDAGADAVYCGFRNETNARNFPGLNFSPEELAEGAAYAHGRGAKVLVAINTFPRAGAVELWHRAVDDAVAAGADALTGNGAGPIFIEDRRGNSKYVAPSARILKTPDESHQAEPGSLVWTIGVVGGLRLVGGH